ARMKELHDAVGARIATMAGSEAAMVTAGATSAMTLGTAACIAGTNRDFIHRLPDTTGMKDEVIIQRGHRYSYEHAIRSCGARLVVVDTAEDLEGAINANTAMMMFNFSQEGQGEIDSEEWIAIGQANGIPTFCDGATMIPPIENLYAIVSYGFDLVCFSGGKGLRGPYSAGLLLGRPDLIEAARLNGAPNDDTIGRGMKVSKEELLGAMVALETSMTFDYESYIRTRREWVQRIAVELEGAAGIDTEMYYPKGENHQPQLRITWDASRIQLTPAAAKKELREGTPSVEVHALSLTDGNLEVTAWMLEPGEAEIVGRRIREVLTGAS
ncbi:selenocysteine synthase, partial [Gemmatimonadota bacterium]